MKITIGTLLWVTGICVAGSESQYMIINFIGMAIFLISTYILFTALPNGFDYNNLDKAVYVEQLKQKQIGYIK